MQRNLLGLTLLIVIGLTVFLLSRKLTLEARKRDSLLLDIIANISGSLDRLDGGLNDIVSQTKTARNRLRHLIVLHRENLLVCALLGEKQRHRRMSGEEKTTKVRRVVQSSITGSKDSYGT